MTRFEHRKGDRASARGGVGLREPACQRSGAERTTQEVRREAAGTAVEVGTEIEEREKIGSRFGHHLWRSPRRASDGQPFAAPKQPVPMAGSYVFEETEAGTRFTTEGETDAHGLFKLAEPVFARIARREWEHSCQTLKEVLEEKPPPTPPSP